MNGKLIVIDGLDGSEPAGRRCSAGKGDAGQADFLSRLRGGVLCFGADVSERGVFSLSQRC